MSNIGFDQTYYQSGSSACGIEIDWTAVFVDLQNQPHSSQINYNCEDNAKIEILVDWE